MGILARQSPARPAIPAKSPCAIVQQADLHAVNGHLGTSDMVRLGREAQAVVRSGMLEGRPIDDRTGPTSFPVGRDPVHCAWLCCGTEAQWGGAGDEGIKDKGYEPWGTLG